MKRQYLSLHEARAIWTSTMPLKPRTHAYVIEVNRLAHELGLPFDRVAKTAIFYRYNVKWNRPFKWSPAELAFVKGEIDRIEDWVDPNIQLDSEPEPEPEPVVVETRPPAQLRCFDAYSIDDKLAQLYERMTYMEGLIVRLAEAWSVNTQDVAG